MVSRAPMVSLALLLAVAAPADAGPAIRWARHRLSPLCEPPHVFYSTAHVGGRPPCCATIEGMCAGGGACPPTGHCPDNSVCVPGPVVDRPNVILFIADDQGACHYGASGECRSVQSGTPVPAPKTPNVDLLAGYGTMFPVAHNTASWCFPSLASMLTGRYQKTFGGQRRVNETSFSTVPSVLRGLTGDPAATPDPYNAGNKIGGYCTLLAGKFIGSLDEGTFDARARTGGRTLGRNDCVAGPSGSPPRCGTAMDQAQYQPFVVGRQTDVFNFLDMLLYQQPGSMPAQYAMQHFFVWYAPRIPHQPLRAPQPVKDYLFGGLGTFPRGGLMNLGQWCTGASCAPVVSAFDENNFGTVHEFFANVWWADDNVRELRKFLAMESAPHCIGSDGRSRFDVSQAQCQTWSSVLPDLPRNTIFMFLSDNGWHLPKSKHSYTENGYRTALFVFDPRTLPDVPHWDPEVAGAPPAPHVAEALAHTNDVLPTALGFALGTSGSQACPVGPDGRACDGRDLRPLLATAAGGPAAPETLRHALCGHETKRPTKPDSNRFLLTRPGSVGRCTRSTAAVCTTAADCAPAEFCLGGHCAAAVGETACATTAACPAGAACLGGRCRMGPPCIDDAACTALVGADYVCAGKEQRWCRNDPNTTCTTRDDCPTCPSASGNPVPCKRLCEARMLKFYANPGTVPGPELTDLFVDPDEEGLHKGESPLLASMSSLAGPYASTMRQLNCCIDAWWPEIGAQLGSLCTAGFSCPADFSCVE